jgi:hypothetical protein
MAADRHGQAAPPPAGDPLGRRAGHGREEVRAIPASVAVVRTPGEVHTDNAVGISRIVTLDGDVLGSRVTPGRPRIGRVP